MIRAFALILNSVAALNPGSEKLKPSEAKFLFRVERGKARINHFKGNAMLKNKQIEIVRRSFARVMPRADRFTADFYEVLFRLQPALRLLFHDDLAAQKKKLVDLLETVIALLDEPAKLLPVLEDSGRRHALYGVRERHYELVGAAIHAALRKSLGAAFDEEAAAAWSQVYGLMSETMIGGARALKSADSAGAKE
jgi:hemoglobin-like flavoprotein